MAHVTFVHGIANKPAPDRLSEGWLRTLSAAGLDLGGQGVTSRMVYWADILYASPEPTAATIESAAPTQDLPDAAHAAPAPPSHTIEEAAFVAGLAAKIGATLAATDQTSTTLGSNVERVPLPWSMKKAFLGAFLRDVHHYLFDVECQPRPGEIYRVRRTIRERFVKALRAVAGPPHVVVSHSMGTVIAYDCLKNVVDCPPIDVLVTMGSPLGIDEVQDKLEPGYSRQDGFPVKIGRWYNFSDRLDPVCGFDPAIANDFKLAGNDAIVDVAVQNIGAWRHSIDQYLRQADLTSALIKELGL